MNRNLKSGICLVMLAMLSLPAGAVTKESLKDVAGMATFTADGVNLRKGPSASDPYLIYLQGEELYFDADNIGWSDELGSMRINGKIVHPDHTKIQGNSGETYPLTGFQDDWVKLDYLGNEVWTMKKFVKISQLIPLSTAMTVESNGYNSLNLTGTEDGSPALLFQEAGMDEDQGFYIGHVEGNAIIFDYFIPFELIPVPTLKENAWLTKSDDGDWLTLRIGPHQLLEDYNVPDVSSFKADRIKAMTRGQQPLPDGQCLIIVNTEIGTKTL